MSMVIERRASRVARAQIIKEAQIKPARSLDTSTFEMVAQKFVTAVKNIRAVMKELGSSAYDEFKGGFEECDALLQDPLFIASDKAKYALQVLQGADSWCRHEADKLGEDYVSPKHFYKIWTLAAERDW